MWTKNIACHFSKRQILPIIKPSVIAVTSESEPLGEFRMEKNRILALAVKMHIKGIISMHPDSYIFLYIEKH